MLARKVNFWLKIIYSIVNWLGVSINQNNGKDVLINE